MLLLVYLLERQGTAQGPSPTPVTGGLRYRKETEWIKVTEHLGVKLSFLPACFCLGFRVAYTRLQGAVRNLLNLN